MVAIGQGRLDEKTVKERLASLKRDHLPPAAPAQGLSLVGVGFAELAGGPSGFVG
jgi:tRNA U38,U39,U40 pseudouridine synthase TruA